jgi:WD40 repeat protein
VNADPDSRSAPAGEKKDGGGAIDARGAMGVQVGEGNTQIVYSYSGLTWTDGVVPPPLATISGVIDSPYRGLSAFEERDAAFFFGREAAATQILARMSRQVDGAGLLVVSGVSGAGKSSLLRAGVLPRLRGTGLVSARQAASWPCLFFTPAHSPLEELAVRVAGLAGLDAATVRRALAADPAGFSLIARQATLTQPGSTAGGPPGSAAQPGRLLLVVDQFEQLFTQCADEEQRQAFITALHAATTARHEPDHEPAALVVLAVRADFEARCAGYPQLAGAVQDRYLVTAMTERQLRLAITEPAKKADASVEDGLTEELLREVHARHPAASSVGVLPLLSHALDQAWRSRTGEILTLADYERTGGIEGAVADSAQRAYHQLTPAQQAATRQVFTRLTACSDGVDTADRALRTELTEGKTPDQAADVETVLEAFASERLLILAAGTVEISHEIVLTAWPLLRDVWLAETHADRIVRTRLDTVAAEWARSSHDKSYLYTGSLLQSATETATRINADPARHTALNHTEREFLQASAHAHRRSIHRREGFIAFLMALVLGLTTVTILAFLARQEALRQRDMATAGRLINESELLADRNPTMSKLLSVAAWRLHQSSATWYAMLAAAANPAIAGLTGHNDRVHAVAFGPHGKLLASGSYDGTVRLWDVRTHSPSGTPLKVTQGQVYSVAFAPNGTTLASGDSHGMVRLWNVHTHQSLGPPIRASDGDVKSVAFSPNSSMVASGGEDGTVRLWNVHTHQEVGPALPVSDGEINSVAFSPDGTLLAIGGSGGYVQLWNVNTHERIGSRFTGAQGALSVAFNHDGTRLASGGADGAVRLWDIPTMQSVVSWSAGGPVFSVAFSRDDTTLASGNLNDTVQLWDVATQQPVGSPLTGYSIAFSPDGKILATGGYDHTVRLWSVPDCTGMATLGHSKPVHSVAFSQSGAILASGSADGTVRLWDVHTRRPAGSVATGQEVWSVALSPNGRMLATGGATSDSSGSIRLWDAHTLRQLGQLRSGDLGPVLALAFSPDGNTLASGSRGGKIRLWDVWTHHQLGKELTGTQGPVNSVAFSPDGLILASGGSDEMVRLWNVHTHHQTGTLTGTHGPVNSVAFNHDGTILAGGGADDTVRLWNVHTRDPIRTLTGHADQVRSVAFSPDGKTLASGSSDGTVRLWDVATFQQIGDAFNAAAKKVFAVAFSPDGKTLASGNGDGTVRLWDVAYLIHPMRQLCESLQYVPPGMPYRTSCS